LTVYVCSSDTPGDRVDHKRSLDNRLVRGTFQTQRVWESHPAPRCTWGTSGVRSAVSLTRSPLSYFRRRRVRLSARFRLRPELSLPSRFAFAATCRRYRWTISLPEAPAIRLAVASKAACIFSLTISSASRRALLPPRISFIIRSAITPFASTANNIKELTICPLCIAAYQDERAEMVPDTSFERRRAEQSVAVQCGATSYGKLYVCPGLIPRPSYRDHWL
jgi:hypothetical protein